MENASWGAGEGWWWVGRRAISRFSGNKTDKLYLSTIEGMIILVN